jgi:hypothetical protein
MRGSSRPRRPAQGQCGTSFSPTFRRRKEGVLAVGAAHHDHARAPARVYRQGK